MVLQFDSGDTNGLISAHSLWEEMGSPSSDDVGCDKVVSTLDHLENSANHSVPLRSGLG